MTRRPRIRRNRWDLLPERPLGAWTPELSVSVVLPAYADQQALDLVCAALAAQSYPDHLIDLVIVDDGSSPPLVRPPIVPSRTRLITATAWGKPRAVIEGVAATEGDVLHLLDADMVLHRDHLEALMRWHHEADYAVAMGGRGFLAPAQEAAVRALSPHALTEAIAAGRLDDLIDGEPGPHWTETMLARTRDLTRSGPRAMRAHIGTSTTMTRALYDAAGGMSPDLPLGEDTELGYRLREAGALFVHDRAARALHLGESNVRERADQVNRHNRPYLADLVPEYRAHRLAYPRPYRVPYVEVVLTVDDAPLETVGAAIDALLSGPLPDVVVTLVGAWDRLEDRRRPILEDPDLDLRLIHARHASDLRVRYATSIDSPRSDASFRLWCQRALTAGDALDNATLADLLTGMEKTQDGVLHLTQDGATVGRLERSAALARALLVADPREPLLDVVAEVYGARTVTV